MKLTKQKKKKIFKEMGGSMYRMNASGCNYYGFSLTGDGSWCGMFIDGHDAKNGAYGYQYVMDLKTGECVRQDKNFIGG